MNLRLSGPDLSLNRPLDADSEDGAEMIEMLPENKPSQEDVVSHKQLAGNRSQVLSEALTSLNEREAQIFSARKLIDNPLTLDALSVQYNISKERVRQIETRAFEKVQNYVLARMSGDGQMKIVS
jgi:RNA polymerase sigma-32 factor